MRRLSNSIRFLMLILLFSLAGIPAHADNATYSITGVMVFTGNNTCTPAPCTESVAFSFDLGYQFNGVDYLATASNGTSVWTGSIGSFTQSSPTLFIGNALQAPSGGGCSGGPDPNYIGFFDIGTNGTTGDEADLHLCDNVEPTPVVPSLSFTDIYRCDTPACSSGFGPGIIFWPGVLEDVTIAQIPEPPTLLLLASGMLALGLLGTTHRKFLT